MESKERDRLLEQAMRHMDDLYGLALHLCRNENDAADLLQETYLKAVQGLPGFREGDLRAWLARIMRNTFINGYRRNKPFRDRVSIDHLGPGGLDELIAARDRLDPPGQERHLARRLEGEVAAALDALPDAFREAVVLVDLHDYSYREAAEVMGSPVGTVMSRLARGRRMLQEALRGYAVREGFIRESRPEAEVIRLARNGSDGGGGR